jgi:hypothetical protein
MDDMTLTAELPENNSTVIDTDIQGVKSGGGKPAIEPTPEKEAPRKPESARDSLEAEAKKIAAESEKEDGDEKPVAENKEPEKPKAEVKESEAKAKDANEPEAKPSPKPSEGRKIIEAPARFLPRAKELWANVPHPVREEFDRVMRESETEIAQYKEAKQFRDDVKEFEELAQRHGVPFKQVLTNYVDIERKFSEDPAQGFRQLMQNMNMHPTQAIGAILRSVNATPQQLAQMLTNNPEAFTALAPNMPRQTQQAQQQQRAPDPEISALKEQVQALHAERVANDIIRPFAQEYPEYHEHEEAIAKVLQSGIIDQIHGSSLSPRDKLEAALFMVAPHVKRGSASGTVQDNSVQGGRTSETPAVDLRGGNKSVKSSLGDVTDVAEPERKMSMREMLEDEARKLARKAS